MEWFYFSFKVDCAFLKQRNRYHTVKSKKAKIFSNIYILAKAKSDLDYRFGLENEQFIYYPLMYTLKFFEMASIF